MTQITVADLDNAKLDVDTIAAIANSTDDSVVDRLGATRLTIYKITNNGINQQLLGWAYAEAFAVTTATRDANNLITSAIIVWPDGATGAFTTDTINATFNAIDAWHATHILDGVTKTVTQTAVTRNAEGAVTAQPVITII